MGEEESCGLERQRKLEEERRLGASVMEEGGGEETVLG